MRDFHIRIRGLKKICFFKWTSETKWFKSQTMQQPKPTYLIVREIMSKMNTNTLGRKLRV